MNGSHLRSMLLGGASPFAVQVLFGVSPASALVLAIALACPSW